MATTNEAIELRALSSKLRMMLLELHASAGRGHLGSALSIVELLTVLFHGHFSASSKGTIDPSADSFILSKGHAAMALYCLLATMGKISREALYSFGQNGSALEPHPNEIVLPQVTASSGSLGQGISIAVGIAVANRMRGGHGRSFVLIGDGEANEGQVWEAARCAAHLQLSNLLVILDENQMQQDGQMSEIMPVGDLLYCWEAMGWECASVDGHDCAAINSVLTQLLKSSVQAPKLLKAATVKGRGVAFLEGVTESHYPPPLSEDDLSMIRYIYADCK